MIGKKWTTNSTCLSARGFFPCYYSILSGHIFDLLYSFHGITNSPFWQWLNIATFRLWFSRAKMNKYFTFGMMLKSVENILHNFGFARRIEVAQHTHVCCDENQMRQIMWVQMKLDSSSLCEFCFLLFRWILPLYNEYQAEKWVCWAK